MGMVRISLSRAFCSEKIPFSLISFPLLVIPIKNHVRRLESHDPATLVVNNWFRDTSIPREIPMHV